MNSKQSRNAATSLVAAGTVLSGDITFCQELVIAGTVNGSVMCTEQDNSVVKIERLVVKEEKRIWVIQASVALVSTALAALFFNSWGYLAGVAYASVAILIPWLTNGIRKEKRALLAPVDEIGDGSCEGESSSDASDCSDCHQ